MKPSSQIAWKWKPALQDGQPIAELDPRAFRARIGLVPQEPVIFSADAAANIRYGRPDATAVEIRAAAEAAAATEFLDRLPDGFATFLGEKGVRLSGGNRSASILRWAFRHAAPSLAHAHLLTTNPRSRVNQQKHSAHRGYSGYKA